MMIASLMESGLCCLVLLSWSVCCFAGDQGLHWSSLKRSNSDRGSFKGNYGPGLLANQSENVRFPLSHQLPVRRKPSSGYRNESSVPLSAVLKPRSRAGGSRAGGSRPKVGRVPAAGLVRTAAPATPAPGLAAGAYIHVAPNVRKQAVKGIPIHLRGSASLPRSKAAFSHSVQPAQPKTAPAAQRAMPAPAAQRAMPAPAAQRANFAPPHRSKSVPAHRLRAKPATSLIAQPASAPSNSSQLVPVQPAPHHLFKSAPSPRAQVSQARSNPSDSVHRASVSYPGLPGSASSVGSGRQGSVSTKAKANRPGSINERKPGKDSQSSAKKSSDSAFRHKKPMEHPQVDMWPSQSGHDLMSATDSGEFVPGDLSQMRAEYEHGDEEFETETSHPQSSEETASESKPLRPSWLSHEASYPLFLRGKLPPGTITHFSTNYEHGTDHWRDSHYVRMPHQMTHPHAPAPASKRKGTHPYQMTKDYKDLVKRPTDVSIGAQMPKRVNLSRGVQPK